jgi:beta-glucosidase
MSNIDVEPLFPFGFGLSYSKFEISNLELNKKTIENDGELELRAVVKNVTDKGGLETVQIYLTDHYSQVVRPVKQLIAFAKVFLDARQSAKVSFKIHADRTAFTGLDCKRIIESGSFILSVGDSSEDIQQKIDFEIVGESRILDSHPVLDTPFKIDYL